MSAPIQDNGSTAVRCDDWFGHFESRCTPRELQVAEMLMQGVENMSEIARQLGISRGRVHLLKDQVARRIKAAKRAAAFGRDWPNHPLPDTADGGNRQDGEGEP